MLCFLRNTVENETEEAGGGSDPGSQPPAPGPLLWDMSTKMEGPGVREKRGAQHGGSRPLLKLPLFLCALLNYYIVSPLESWILLPLIFAL